MVIDNKILDELSAKAKENPRLRQAMDLRNSPEDLSQRMLNALEPGTVMPIHRHMASSETVTLLRGKSAGIFMTMLVRKPKASCWMPMAMFVASTLRRQDGIRWNASKAAAFSWKAKTGSMSLCRTVMSCRCKMFEVRW